MTGIQNHFLCLCQNKKLPFPTVLLIQYEKEVSLVSQCSTVPACSFCQKLFRLLFYVHPARANMSGKYNLGTGLAKFLQLTNENIQFHGTLEGYFQQH